MRRHNARLYRAARSIVKDDAEAEDIVQEAYVRAFAALDRFDGRASLSTWLVRIAVNEALGRLRKRRPTVDLHQLLGLDEAGGDGGAASFGVRPETPEAAVARSELRSLIEAAIDTLPQAFRTVFVLRAVEEFSVDETADCLGIPKDTVKTRYHRAKRALRNTLHREVQLAITDAFPFGGRHCDRIVDTVLKRLGLAPPG